VQQIWDWWLQLQLAQMLLKAHLPASPVPSAQYPLLLVAPWCCCHFELAGRHRQPWECLQVQVPLQVPPVLSLLSLLLQLLLLMACLQLQ
jgi:hypothetical protein